LPKKKKTGSSRTAPKGRREMILFLITVTKEKSEVTPCQNGPPCRKAALYLFLSAEDWNKIGFGGIDEELFQSVTLSFHAFTYPKVHVKRPGKHWSIFFIPRKDLYRQEQSRVYRFLDRFPTYSPYPGKRYSDGIPSKNQLSPL
jgi:hypothetical protein